MDQFIQQYKEDVIGHLSGFDRLVLRGTLRALAVKSGMLNYLWHVGVLLKDFGRFVQEKSAQLKAASYAEAQRQKRPILYLPSSKVSKEEIARGIAQKDGIHKGLIGILTASDFARHLSKKSITEEILVSIVRSRVIVLSSFVTTSQDLVTA